MEAPLSKRRKLSAEEEDESIAKPVDDIEDTALSQTASDGVAVQDFEDKVNAVFAQDILDQPEGDDKAASLVEEETKANNGRVTNDSRTAPTKLSASSEKPKASHVRFDDEDPPILDVEAMQFSVASQHQYNEEEEVANSDDDMPDAIATSAAKANVKASGAAASKAIDTYGFASKTFVYTVKSILTSCRQRAEAKKKRQETNARLREQSKSSTVKQKKKDMDKTRPELTSRAELPADAPSGDSIGDVFAGASPAVTKKSKLPDLLPDEVLLAEPTIRPPTPPFGRKQEKKPLLQNRHIQLDNESTQDVRVGPVSVSVLEKFNRLLPPRADERSRAIREGWLEGRRVKGSGMFERKKVGGGFLRR